MKQRSDDLAGKTLGNCTLEKLIGRGGMGTVYLARQARPARNVAVKVLQPDLAPDSQVYQEFLTRFRREADVIARLEHINIMPIYEYGEQDGLAYLVMPYLTGGSLRDKLSEQGTLPFPEVVRYIQQTAAALDYAHAQGVIHRDLKPGNFLLHADGRLILADFGIARIMTGSTIGSTLTDPGTMLGTPDYMAPEMIRGEPIDYRADIYELGVVLFQLLSGRLPFSSTMPFAVIYQHTQTPLPLLHLTQPQIPPEVDAVIQKATAKQREARYSSVQAMTDALSASGNSLVPAMQNTPPISAPTMASSSANSPVQQNASAIPASPPIILSSPSRVSESESTQPAPAYHVPQLPGQTRAMPTAPAARRLRRLVVATLLAAAVLIVGGVFVSLQFYQGGMINGPSLTPTALSQPGVPVGAQVYAASAPGHNCDGNGGEWVDYSNNIKITCQGSQTRLQNTARTALLQGTFLTKLPGRTYPTDYAVVARIEQDQQSASDFGLYFRNQPGNQLGAYTFLVHSNGTWNAYVYDNNTGAATQLTGGSFGDAHAQMTLAVIVKGAQFHFYANGRELGSVTDKTYSSGTTGIVVDQGGTITASYFALYDPAP